MKTFEFGGNKYQIGGWKPETPDHRDILFKVPVFTWPLPNKADLSGICTLVEDQKDVGSCTACACTSAMEALYRKANKPSPQLSKLFVYYATRVWIEKSAPGDDSGAQIRNVMKALVKFGACDEALWPYKADMFDKEPSPQAQDNAKSHVILQYQRCQNLTAILRSIAGGFPVVGGFAVPASMMTPAVHRSGLVPYPKPSEEIIGGHAVKFMGYDLKKKLLKFINSWGTIWGEQGFGYLPFDFVVNNLADDFWAIRTETGV